MFRALNVVAGWSWRVVGGQGARGQQQQQMWGALPLCSRLWVRTTLLCFPPMAAAWEGPPSLAPGAVSSCRGALRRASEGTPAQGASPVVSSLVQGEASQSQLGPEEKGQQPAGGRQAGCWGDNDSGGISLSLSQGGVGSGSRGLGEKEPSGPCVQWPTAGPGPDDARWLLQAGLEARMFRQVPGSCTCLKARPVTPAPKPTSGSRSRCPGSGQHFHLLYGEPCPCCGWAKGISSGGHWPRHKGLREEKGWASGRWTLGHARQWLLLV